MNLWIHMDLCIYTYACHKKINENRNMFFKEEAYMVIFAWKKAKKNMQL